MYVKKLVIENLKSFSRAEFDFSQENSNDFAGLSVLVGGNASGKSSVLRLIAMALMGPDQSRQLMGDVSSWLSHGQTTGKCFVEFGYDAGLDKFASSGNRNRAFEAGLEWKREQIPISNTQSFPARVPRLSAMEGTTRGEWAEKGPWNLNSTGWFGVGYGPFRRLRGSAQDALKDALTPGPVGRFVSLFREDVALSEAEEWLKKLRFQELEARSSKKKGTVRQTILADVLKFLNDGLLPQGFRVQRVSSDDVWVGRDRINLTPMKELSDGCRSVYALMLDIIRQLSMVYADAHLFKVMNDRIVVDLPGVVLIDEIESHLHPSWQREFPVWLKERFPRIQFIVSTHSPLVVQAADPNGVFVLPMPGEESGLLRKLSGEESDRVRFGRAEKTLLGQAFGLQSTRSKWAVAQIEEYRRMSGLQRAGRLTDAREQSRFQDLKLTMQRQFEFEDSLEPK